LIELVVVVLVLGILTAVAAPKLLSVANTATDNGLQQTLYVVRNAIHVYACEQGELPGQTDDLPGDLADYLRDKSFPKCPVGRIRDASVSHVEGNDIKPDIKPTTSWKYSKTSGEFIVNWGKTAQAQEGELPANGSGGTGL